MNKSIRLAIQREAKLDRAGLLILPTRMGGRFKLEAVNAGDGRRRVLADWFPNLVTNGGLDYVGNNTGWLTNCYVGSGNTAPANGNTALVSLVASTSTQSTSTGTVNSSSPYYGSRVNTYRFAQGAAAGNLSEIGIGPSSSALFSRALILDGVGSPTTITVLGTEFLDATYEFRTYPPLVDVTGNVTIAAVSYAYTARAASAGGGNWAMSSSGDQAGLGSLVAYSGALGAITSSPAGSSSAESSGVTASYSAGSFQRDRTATFGLGQANFGGGGVTAIGCSLGGTFGSFGNMQVGFSPGIPKDNTKVMTLTVRQSWTRGPV